MCKRSLVLIMLLSWTCLPLMAQDTGIGIAMPITLTGELVATQRLQTFAPSDSNLMPAGRGVFYPSLTLGDNWYAYAAFQVSSVPFFYYDMYYPTRGVQTDLLQAFVGYSKSSGSRAIHIKVGKLSSAFGAYPLRYDDAQNPLLDVPLTYGAYTGLRADQLPCGVGDLLAQRSYAYIRFSCGGGTSNEYGLWLGDLYGLPGAEADVSWGHLDARFQLTNSSPVYPQPLDSDSQHAQWTAGGGYTIRQGFRVGVSAFRGPFLTQDVAALLPPAATAGDFPATAVGTDIQWAMGRWSTSGEWQWNQFQYPGFRIAPAIQSAYAEGKVILTPRYFAAVRISSRWQNRPEDAVQQSDQPFEPNMQAYEFAAGFHINHFQQIKLGYEWVRTAGVSGSRANVLGVQFVTSVNSLSKAFK